PPIVQTSVGDTAASPVSMLKPPGSWAGTWVQVPQVEAAYAGGAAGAAAISGSGAVAGRRSRRSLRTNCISPSRGVPQKASVSVLRYLMRLLTTGGQHLGQVVAHGLLQLIVRAAAGVAVGPPALEVGGVPESRALHVLVRDLADQVRPDRHPRQVLLGVPAAEGAGHAAVHVRLGPRPLRPRVAAEVRHLVRLQLLHQLLASLHRERGGHAH